MDDQVLAVIDNCEEACVYEEPSSDSDILGMLKRGSEIIVDLNDSTDDFYMLYTKYGLGGFCLKELVSF